MESKSLPSENISTKSQGRENQEWGAEAEEIAAQWLLIHGYTIRERNWRMGRSVEIDIIAEIPGTIVFVEVKARKGNETEPLASIDLKKINRIVRGADIYLQNLDKLFQYRFDIITLTGTKDNYSLEHYPDAFYPPFKTPSHKKC